MDWLEARVTEIRQRITPGDEGSHWCLFFSDRQGAPVIASVVDGAMADVDAQLLRGIALIVNGVPAPACLVAVVRMSGIARDEDHRMWRDLQPLVLGGRERLIGLLIVGVSTYCYLGVDRGLATAA